MKNLLLLGCVLMALNVYASMRVGIEWSDITIENNKSWDKITAESDSWFIKKPLKVIIIQNKKGKFTQIDIIYGEQVYVLDEKTLELFDGYSLAPTQLMCSKIGDDDNIFISVCFTNFYEEGKLQDSRRLLNFDAKGTGLYLDKQKLLDGKILGDSKKLEIKPITLKEYEKIRAKDNSQQE